MKKYLLLLIPFFLFGFLGQSFAEEDKLVKLIQLQYKSIKSFKGHFVQTSFRTNPETEPRTAKGMVSFKRPGKMRWLYDSPDEQLLVTNGKTLWLYDPLLENVTVQQLEKLAGGTALSFLLGLGDLSLDFERRKISKNLLQNPTGLIVELVPKKESANLAFIQLDVKADTYNFRTIALMDQQGNHRTIVLESMKYNLELQDQLFEFEITPDMEVIESGN